MLSSIYLEHQWKMENLIRVSLGGLATDGVGNFYGTASLGGTNNDGCGTLFQLDGGWHFGVLHTFNDLTGDGCQPQADLNFFDSFILGTTVYGGGPSEQGTVFTSGPGWYSFWPFRGNNGTYPNGLGLFGDSVYGTTNTGGGQGRGDVFELSYSTIKVKHVFTSTDKAGDRPVGDLATQVNANGVRIMYGATSSGGAGRRGAVYQLTESQSQPDVWDLSVLYSFSGPDGAYPGAGLVLDPSGNLYGTTYAGGTEPGSAGTVFKLTPVAKNKWNYTLLYSFTGGTDGGSPFSTVVLDSAGNLYGTTSSGGAYNQGVVYEIVNTTAVVKPTSLTFGPQRLQTTSPAKRITLFNKSPLPITVTSVNLQGDFAVSANKCQNGVKPNTHCDVYVTFTPTGTKTNPLTGSITFVDTAFNSPQSAQLSGTVGVSQTLVNTSGSPSFMGQPVTFTATVTSAQGAIPDGELVTFYDRTTPLGSAALVSETAAFTTTLLSAKKHDIKATYAGDAAFDPSTGDVTQVVDKYQTTTALSSSLNPSNYGQAVTFTATVTSSGPTPTGKVAFKDGTKGLRVVALTGGVASYTTSKLAVGTHGITTEY
jgi:uncharacterized repeat protein (TIGR03803 family)